MSMSKVLTLLESFLFNRCIVSAGKKDFETKVSEVKKALETYVISSEIYSPIVPSLQCQVKLNSVRYSH